MAAEKVYAVFGLGTFGTVICEALAAKGGKVIAVDREETLVDKVKDMVAQAMVIDSTDDEALKNAGLGQVDGAIVAIGDDIDASILTTAILKNLGIPQIISRAVSDIHAQVLRQIGATEVLILEEEQGRRLASRLLAPNMMEAIPLAAGQTMAELRVPESMTGKSIRTLALRQKYGITVVSVRRTVTTLDEVGNPVKQEQVATPRPDDILTADDVLVFVGSAADVEKMREV